MKLPGAPFLMKLFMVVFFALNCPAEDEKVLLNLDQIITSPQEHLGQKIGVRGLVDTLDVYDLKKDLSIISLKIRSPESKAIFIPQNSDKETFQFVGAFQEALKELNSSMDSGISISGHMHKELNSLSLDFKASVGKSRSIATEYTLNNNGDIAKSISDLAQSYNTLGDAYQTFAEVALYNDSLTENVANKSFNLEKTQKSSALILKSGKLFLQGIYLLNAQKGNLTNSFNPYDPDSIPIKSAYNFIIFGHELDSNAWQYRKLNKKIHEKNSRLLSQAFLKAGESVLVLTQSLHDLGKQLHKRLEGKEAPRAIFPTLRCAYYGFNQTHLRKAAEKIKRLGQSYQVIIWGELIKKNLQAETDLVWIQIESIDIDGLTIPINHEDKNSAIKDAMDFYNWASGKEEE